jgi:hypothetical protein
MDLWLSFINQETSKMRVKWPAVEAALPGGQMALKARQAHRATSDPAPSPLLRA